MWRMTTPQCWAFVALVAVLVRWRCWRDARRQLEIWG
jgi:hypothetical protein